MLGRRKKNRCQLNGELIRQKREELGWERKDLAKRVSEQIGEPITPQAIYNYENRYRTPEIDILTAIAMILDIPMKDLWITNKEVHPVSV